MSANSSGLERINVSDEMAMKINEATVAIVQSYLNYAGSIIRDVLSKQGYTSEFKEINDDLVIKPNELIELIDKIQAALVSATD